MAVPLYDHARIYRRRKSEIDAAIFADAGWDKINNTIRQALLAVKYEGWITAEVPHGDLEALKDIGRADYVGCQDDAALAAFVALARGEGIVGAFESCHAIAHALKIAEERDDDPILLVNLSGRGDKDMAQAQKLLGAAV